jgi:hypothetical protein
MNRKLISMTVLTLLLTSLLLMQVAYAKPAYCDQALGDCKGSCSDIGFAVGVVGAIGGQRWLGLAWQGGCYGGCWIGYSQCGG